MLQNPVLFPAVQAGREKTNQAHDTRDTLLKYREDMHSFCTFITALAEPKVKETTSKRVEREGSSHNAEATEVKMTSA